MKYRLRFNPLMIVLFIVFFGVFSALSVWQVFRVYEKQGIADRITAATEQQAILLSETADQDLPGYEFYSALASGRFVRDACFFVENVIKQGKPGLYFYCPFQLTGSKKLLLVNMGWMARPRLRFDLPKIMIADDLVDIEGIIKQPRSRPVVVDEDGSPNIELDHLWAYFDFDYLNQTMDKKFHAVEFQLMTQLEPLLKRDWSGYDPKIGMHIGYAIHWAVFALVTLGLFVKFNVKKIE